MRPLRRSAPPLQMRVLCRLRQLRPVDGANPDLGCTARFSPRLTASVHSWVVWKSGPIRHRHFWPSSATNPDAARKSSRPLPTPGGVPSRRRRGTAVKSLSVTADAPSGAPADPGRFRPLFLGGGSRLVIPPAQPDSGVGRAHRLMWSPCAHGPLLPSRSVDAATRPGLGRGH